MLVKGSCDGLVFASSNLFDTPPLLFISGVCASYGLQPAACTVVHSEVLLRRLIWRLQCLPATFSHLLWCPMIKASEVVFYWSFGIDASKFAIALHRGWILGSWWTFRLMNVAILMLEAPSSFFKKEFLYIIPSWLGYCCRFRLFGAGDCCSRRRHVRYFYIFCLSLRRCAAWYTGVYDF